MLNLASVLQQVKGRFQLILDWFEPMALKEWRAHRHLAQRRKMRLISLSFAAACVLMAFIPSIDQLIAPSYYNDSDLLIIVAIKLGLIAGFCAWVMLTFTAGAIAREREEGSLDLLALTRLSSAQIVLGKLLAGLAVLVAVSFYPLAAVAVGIFSNAFPLSDTFLSLGMLLSTALCIGSLGIFASTWFPRRATAMTVSYVLAFCWLYFLPLLIFSKVLFYLRSSLKDLWLYVIFFQSCLWLFLLATMLISVSCKLLFRITLSRTLEVIMFVLITLIGLLSPLSSAFSSFTVTSYGIPLIGNPCIGMYASLQLLSEPEHSSIMYWFAAFPLLVQLLTAWCAIHLAIRELDRLRCVR